MAQALMFTAAGTTAGTSLLQFVMQRSAAEIQAGEAEVAAKQEELGAVQREADRKSRLASALASQTASAGARGISAFEGSPLSVLEADIQAEKEATERDVFQSQLAALTARAGGKIRERQMKTGATLSLIGDISKAAQTAAGGFG